MIQMKKHSRVGSGRERGSESGSKSSSHSRRYNIIILNEILCTGEQSNSHPIHFSCFFFTVWLMVLLIDTYSGSIETEQRRMASRICLNCASISSNKLSSISVN